MTPSSSGRLDEFVQTLVRETDVIGAEAVVSRDGVVEQAVAGDARLDGTPLRRGMLFRWASITKPVVASATLALEDAGVLRLADPVTRWLPELADRQVLRDPVGPLDDTVPADRDITVRDLLTSQSGYGFTADFSGPLTERLTADLLQGPPRPSQVPAPDEWLRRLSPLPLLHQPGRGWSYNASQDVLGVLLERATGRDLGAVLAEHLLDPLGMRDTGFGVPDDQRHRLTDAYASTTGADGGDGGITVTDPWEDGDWADPPRFRSGAGGLLGTADDWLAFGTMLLAGGRAPDGRQLLHPDQVRDQMTDHLTPAERAAGTLFLDGQGWGYGGSVDPGSDAPWSSRGRYGWVGGTGTVGLVDPSRRTVGVLLTQLAMGGPDSLDLVQRFWTHCR